jgi:hypothetical protein
VIPGQAGGPPAARAEDPDALSSRNCVRLTFTPRSVRPFSSHCRLKQGVVSPDPASPMFEADGQNPYGTPIGITGPQATPETWTVSGKREMAAISWGGCVPLSEKEPPAPLDEYTVPPVLFTITNVTDLPPVDQLPEMETVLSDPITE